MKNNEIKSLIPIECPHCKKGMMIELNTFGPEFKSIQTPETLTKAKNDAIIKIAELEIPDENKKQAIEWINDPETVITEDGIESLIETVKEQYKIK